jgi:hypothetical protein
MERPPLLNFMMLDIFHEKNSFTLEDHFTCFCMKGKDIIALFQSIKPLSTC